MDLFKFQADAIESAVYEKGLKVMYPALGMAGEAGEVCNKVKKVFRDDAGVVSEEKRNAIASEIGDVLWYCAALCHDLGVQLGDIAAANITKLHSRKARGTLQGNGDNR